MKQYVKLLEGKRLRLDLLARHSALTGVFAVRLQASIGLQSGKRVQGT